MYDLIVIGGGPAGLTATMYAIRKRINVLKVARDLGGKTQWRLALPWVEDYQVIRGLEVVNKFKSELEYLDFARHMEAVEKVERKGDGFLVRTRGGGELETKAAIIASGAKQTNVPGIFAAGDVTSGFAEQVLIAVGEGAKAALSAYEYLLPKL